jgi:hypothetical protein
MKFKLLSLFVCISSIVSAQSLSSGSIAFLGYQTNAPDGFTFITLTELAPSTSIHFTDNGWDGNALFSYEESLTWISPNSILAPGSVIYIYDDNVTNGTSPMVGSGSVTGELPSLSSSGDQILAYTGSESNPTFIAAITNSNWLTTCVTGTPNANATCLPSPLVSGLNAQSPVNSSSVVTNMFFTSSTLTGTPAQILAQLTNPANWTISNDIAVAGATQWPNWNIAITPPAPAIANFELTTLNLIEGVIQQSIEITFSTPVFGSQTLSLNLSGITQVGDYSSNPLFVGNSIPISVPSGSTSASFLLGASTDGIFEGIETGTLTLGNFSGGMVAGSSASISITIEEPNGVSLVQLLESSSVINESDGSLTLSFSIEPPATQPGLFTVQFSNGQATTAEDYSTLPATNAGLIVFPVQTGESLAEVILTITDDLIPEGLETITISILSAENGLLVGGNSEIELSIAENDAENIPTTLFINELMASNTNTILNSDGNYSDWIELYNSGSSAIDLAGLYISDDETNPYKYMFPSGSSETIIPAGGFKMIWADDSTELGPLHVNFRISNAGEFIGLYAASSNPIEIDTVYSPVLEDDQSWGRSLDGSGNWVLFDVGATTAGISNAETGFTSIDSIDLKVFPNPSSEVLYIQNQQSETIQFSIFTIHGQFITSGSLSGNKTINISVSEFTSGLYTLTFLSKRSFKHMNVSILN